ncbi:hypothetical protein NBRC116493_19480 [Aurantivibrio infirmus]
MNSRYLLFSSLIFSLHSFACDIPIGVYERLDNRKQVVTIQLNNDKTMLVNFQGEGEKPNLQKTATWFCQNNQIIATYDARSTLGYYREIRLQLPDKSNSSLAIAFPEYHEAGDKLLFGIFWPQAFINDMAN